MRLARRDHHPERAFMEIPYPPEPPVFAGMPEDADGDARTMRMWARAHGFADMLATAFPDPPPGAAWAFDALEREVFIGDWPDGESDFYAYVSVGVLFDPQDAAARAFADRVRAEAPRAWGAEGAPG